MKTQEVGMPLSKEVRNDRTEPKVWESGGENKITKTMAKV